MQRRRLRTRTLLTAAAALLAGACGVTSDTSDAPAAADTVGGAVDTVAGATTVDASAAARSGETTATTAAPAAPPAPVDTSDLRLEVDVAARTLHVYRNDTRLATHPVAVGSAEWPTQRGAWLVTQVVWNPAWIPPDESWAEARERKEPGDPDNPLGRAQLVYDPPRTIHGTNDPASIGKAVSHGSIRLSNAVITQLARQIMEESGAGRDDAWYRRARENRSEKQIVDLPQPVPIRVR